MSGTDFSQRMARLTDHDVVRIAFAEAVEGYEPEAQQAAREELARRNIATNDIDEIRDEVADLQIADEARRDKPLPWLARIAFLLMGPLSLLTLIAAFALDTRGYKRMSREAWLCMLGNFALLLALFLLAG